MQAPSIFGCVEQQRRFSGACCNTPHNSGDYVVGKRTVVHLGPITDTFLGCSCSNDTGGSSVARIRTLHRLGNRKSLLSPDRSAVLVKSTEFSGCRLPLREFLGCQAKAGWRPTARCSGKKRVDGGPFVNLDKCLDVVKKLTSQVLNYEKLIKPAQEPDDVNANNLQSRSILTAIAVTLLTLTAPAPNLTNSSLIFSDAAKADQLGQLKQAASIFEKAVESLPKVRFSGDAGVQVLEKAVTVVTGSTFIDPKFLDEEVDSLLSGEKDIQQELQNGVRHAAENLSSTVVDVLTNFNPGALSESAGASISAFLEGGAERIAAFELSALVSLGERWLILTPLLVLPMAWEMNRLNKKNEREYREGQEKFQELSGEAALKGGKVRRELERVELRTSVLEAVSSLGKAALEPPRSREEAGLIRRRIKEILERLEDLKPVEDPLLMVPEFASVASKSAVPGDALSYVPTSPTVDGDWHLIYVSEANETGGQQELPQFPGFGLENPRQKVWQASGISSLTDDNNIPSPSPLLARNTAEIRFGSLGVFQVAVEGSWENLKDGERALVSFNTFSARPVEILGNRVSEDVPQFNLVLPAALQRRAEWAVAYVDDHLRINRGSRGQLFLFRKIE